MSDQRQNNSRDESGSLDLPAPINLGAFDPRRDSAHFDARISAIVTGASARRARRRQDADLLARVASWSVPTLVAASLFILVGGATLVLQTTPRTRASTHDTLAEAAGIPAVVVEWSVGTKAPNASELVDAFAAAARTPQEAQP